MSQWFGVAHNDEMETAGWRRTGTLPRRNTAHSYTVLPQVEPDTEVELLGTRNNAQASDGEGETRRSGRRGLQRVTATLTLQRPRRKQTKDEVQETLPKFWPAATIVVAVVEVVLLIALLVTEGFAPIAFSPELISDVLEGYGNISEFVTREEVPNFFIGPSSSSLLHVGAKYTPVSLLCRGCEHIALVLWLGSSDVQGCQVNISLDKNN